MSVALDSMTIIWGLQRGGNPKQSNLRENQFKAAVLIDMLTDDKQTIVLPTVAVAEVLVGTEPDDRPNLLAEFSRLFFCPAFDLRASEKAASLAYNGKSIEYNDRAKRVFKSDVMIVATAWAAGARIFYSDDDGLSSLVFESGHAATEIANQTSGHVPKSGSAKRIQAAA